MMRRPTLDENVAADFAGDADPARSRDHVVAQRSCVVDREVRGEDRTASGDFAGDRYVLSGKAHVAVYRAGDRDGLGCGDHVTRDIAADGDALTRGIHVTVDRTRDVDEHTGVELGAFAIVDCRGGGEVGMGSGRGDRRGPGADREDAGREDHGQRAVYTRQSAHRETPIESTRSRMAMCPLCGGGHGHRRAIGPVPFVGPRSRRRASAGR